jgi:hypothetical protein
MKHETEPNSVAVEKPPKPKKPPGYRKFSRLLKQVISSAPKKHP